jgi:LysM repeat protein
MPDNNSPNPVIYTVKPGDTWTGIAQNFYGLPILWPLIQKANPSVPTDPKSLKAGTQLRIPGPPDAWHRLAAALENNRAGYSDLTAYTGTDERMADSAFLFPPLPSGAHFSTDLTVTINHVYQNLGNGTPAFAVIDNDDFHFTWSPDDSAKIKSPTDVAAVVTIKGNNIWQSNPAARQALQNNFIDFLCQLETVELTSNQLVPGGALVVRQRIGEAIPAPVGETLFYRYGLNPGLQAQSSPYVDLLPGVRLRIEFSANQFISPGSPLNGLVGSGQFHYSIQRDSNLHISFDSFLSTIAAPEIGATGQPLVSNLIDLQAAGTARRHYRLFYPTQITLDASTGSGGLEQNVTLIGADSLADLKNATQAFTTSRQIPASNGSQPVIGLAFRGRAVLIPEICIYITRILDTRTFASSIYIPLGTTLRQLMDQIMPTWNRNGLYIRQLGTVRPITLWRYFAEEYGVPDYRQVLLKPVASDYYPDPAALELPLVGGDELVLTLVSNNQPA